MEPQTTPDSPDTLTAPGLRFTLATRFEAFCPSCGYSLISTAVVLVSFDSTIRHGEYLIAAVCTKCYQNTLSDALAAAAMLGHTLLDPHVEHTHGVRFWMPRPGPFQGQKTLDVLDHLRRGTPLHQQPYLDPPPPEPNQQALDYGTRVALGADPNAPANSVPVGQDGYAAYDPPCPADAH